MCAASTLLKNITTVDLYFVRHHLENIIHTFS